MNTLTCAVVLMCASMALAASLPDKLVQPVFVEEAPVQGDLEESLEPQESAWGGHRHGGFGGGYGGGYGGYRGGYGGYGGGFGHGGGFGRGYGGGYGGGFGGFAVGGIAAGGFRGYGYGR